MSMSTVVYGYLEADQKWRDNKAAWDACVKAGVQPPAAIVDYFQGEYPGNKPGMEIDLEGRPCCHKYHAESESGFEIDVTQLPTGVKIVRFVNLY